MKKAIAGFGLSLMLFLAVLAAFSSRDGRVTPSPRLEESTAPESTFVEFPASEESPVEEASSDVAEAELSENDPSTLPNSNDESAIRGRILGPDGRPCVGFRVVHHWQSSVTTTDAEGRFSIPTTEAGANDPTVLFSGAFGDLTIDHEGWSLDPESLSERTDDGEYLLRALPPGSIELQVVDRATGLPVLEYEVSLFNPNFDVNQDRHSGFETDEFGMKFFETVSAGTLTLTVTNDDYYFTSEAVEVHPRRITRTTLFLDRHPSVFGRVTDPHGRPLVGASVWLNRRLKKTAEDGTFHFERLSPDSFLLQVSHPDALPLPEDRFRIKLGEARDLGDLRLSLGGQLTGTLSLAGGHALLWAHLRVESEDAKYEKKGNYDKRTRGFSFSGVPTGRYRVVANYSARGEVFTHRTEFFELAEGVLLVQDFTLPIE